MSIQSAPCTRSSGSTFTYLKMIIIKFIKEFWLPSLLSLAWTIYSLHSRSEQFTFQSTITTFGPAFFLISWLTGQVFRIKKQADVEKNLNTIEARLENLLQRLEQHAKDLMGNLTGSGSHVQFISAFTGPKTLELCLLNKSAYPVFDIQCRLIDLDEPIDVKKGKLWTDRYYSLNMLAPNKITMGCYKFELKNNSGNFNIFIQTRTAGIMQQIRILNDHENRLVAIRTMVEGVTTEVSGAEGFPGFNPNDPEGIFQDHNVISRTIASAPPIPSKGSPQ